MSDARVTVLGTAAAPGAASTPYLIVLEDSEREIPGGFARLADLLDERREAGFAVGAQAEWEVRELLRTVPDRIDPFRIALTNEYPAASMYRRSALVELGGWRRLTDELDAQSDWSLWMSLAEAGHEGIHLGTGELSYVHFVRRGTLTEAGRRGRRSLRAALRARHFRLFDELPAHRRASGLSAMRRVLFPMVYGDRRRLRAEGRVKDWLDEIGVWTQGEVLEPTQSEALDRALAVPERRAVVSGDSPRIAVITPTHDNGAEAVRAVRSIAEDEPVEVVVVDDGSTDPVSRRALEQLDADEATVVHHPSNRGVSAARTTALENVSAAYVFALDADDLAIPGALARMADRLDANAGTSVCFGNYAELQVSERVLDRVVSGETRLIDADGAALRGTLLRRSALGDESAGVHLNGPPVLARWVRRRAGDERRRNSPTT